MKCCEWHQVLCLRPSVEPTSPGSVFFRVLYCSRNCTVQFLSLLMFSPAPRLLSPLSLQLQYGASLQLCTCLEAAWGYAVCMGLPRLGPCHLQWVEKGSGTWVWVLSWCPVLNSLVSFSTYSFLTCPHSCFWKFSLVKTYLLSSASGLFCSAHTVLDNILTF